MRRAFNPTALLSDFAPKRWTLPLRAPMSMRFSGKRLFSARRPGFRPNRRHVPRSGTREWRERIVMAGFPEIGRTEAHCFTASNLVFCEFELPGAGAPFHYEDASLVVVAGRQGHGNRPQPPELSEIVARSVRAVSGFERVMVYRFEIDGDGEVVGESLAEDWGQSFMGLRFPASDIPPQARALYRVSHPDGVPSATIEPVPLTPAASSQGGDPFDLSLSLYRSISPVHQAYQENIGADGAMSSVGPVRRQAVGVGDRSPSPPAQGRRRQPPSRGHHRSRLQHRARWERKAQTRSAWRTGGAAHSAILSKLAVTDDCLRALSESGGPIAGLLPGCIRRRRASGPAMALPCPRCSGETPPPRMSLHWPSGSGLGREGAGFSPPTAFQNSTLPFFPTATRRAAFSPCSSTTTASRRCCFSGRKLSGPSPGRASRRSSPDRTGLSSLPRRSFDLWIEAKRNRSRPWRARRNRRRGGLPRHRQLRPRSGGRRLKSRKPSKPPLEANRAKRGTMRNSRRRTSGLASRQGRDRSLKSRTDGFQLFRRPRPSFPSSLYPRVLPNSRGRVRRPARRNRASAISAACAAPPSTWRRSSTIFFASPK